MIKVGLVKTDTAVPTLTPSGMLLRVTELVVPNVSKDSLPSSSRLEGTNP